ncbi:PD-(D/E)XK nuclease family protein [Rhodopirellula sp. ICT_H3.1]|uniref:PD-(D/E)XK nuclease family protein n=1 Tax=Aporhodopirellula aestuarii TaxID=2950107 RepID=A0ABT0U585_9BACT|nr:PD-(D/E)XK nuclease family protein [Aporhodopirellula aestuarii]
MLQVATKWLIENAGQCDSTNRDAEAMPLLADQLDADDEAGDADAVEMPAGDASALMIDLSSLDVVLPSSRAVTRLQEKLRMAAQAAGAAYRPPRFYLVGRLPSLLYRRPAEWASDFEQTLAWARVLAASEPASLQTLVPRLPEADATTGWLDLATTARRLWTKTSAENWTFSDVAGKVENHSERRRWEFLLQVHHDYLAELKAAERCDPNAAALDAIADKRCRALRPLVLIGASDLPEMVKVMLSQIETPVTSLVAAPDEMANHFDSLGCLVPEKWKDHVLPVRDDQLIPAAGIEDQSHCVSEVLAEFGETYSVDAITIGVTDESQIEPIENQCRLLKVDTYRHLGWTVSETSVGRLIDLIVTYRQRRTWRSLAALVRHAAVYAMIEDYFRAAASEDDSKKSKPNWLTTLDQLMSEAFPRSVDQPLPTVRFESKLAGEIRDCVEEWLTPLSQKRQTIRKWSKVLAEMLTRVFPQADEQDAKGTCGEPSRTSKAIEAACQTLHGFEELSVPLDTPVDSITAIELLSARIAEINLPDTPAPDKIEILGWLDLVLDDAPALVLCGLNHPFVPEASSGDPFLPSSLQKSLNQRINDRRYARDVHAMQQMLCGREQTRFLVGTHSADGSPTPPSRLLAAATADDAARRVCGLLTGHRPSVQVVLDSSSVASLDQSKTERMDYFRPPPPQPGRTIETLSVTAFSAYLACPYRFYLRYVLRLRPLDDSALELAANQFGDLVHGALEYFGESDAKDESDPTVIEAELIEQLHRFAEERYGTNTASTVALQVRQAERRLKTVALRQAERIAQGWRIHAVEASVDELDIDRKTRKPKKPTGILLDGQFTGLRGRFDRIDFHPETNRWAILDYKTHGHLPEKKHLKKLPDGSTTWVDLQLPLYRRFIPDLGIPADPVDVELGYFNVAEKDAETKVNVATFTEAQFAQADELIHHCVRQIRNCHFEPNEAGVEYDDYEMMFNEATTTIAVDDEDEFSGNEVTR